MACRHELSSTLMTGLMFLAACTMAVVAGLVVARGSNMTMYIANLLPYESEGIIGAIAGRALYEGKLDFKAAIKAAKGE